MLTRFLRSQFKEQLNKSKIIVETGVFKWQQKKIKLKCSHFGIGSILFYFIHLDYLLYGRSLVPQLHWFCLFVCLFDFTDLLWKIPLVLVLITLLQVFLYENYFKLLWLADWYIQRGKIRRNDLNTIKRFES